MSDDVIRDLKETIAELELKCGPLTKPIEYTFCLSKFVKATDVFVMEKDENDFLIVSGTILTDDLCMLSIAKYIKERNQHKFKQTLDLEWRSLVI